MVFTAGAKREKERERERESTDGTNGMLTYKQGKCMNKGANETSELKGVIKDAASKEKSMKEKNERRRQ